MFKEQDDSLTIKPRESMSKIFHNPTIPAIYSLSKELIEIANELTLLEKKIQLGNDLLTKVGDKALILKLEKQKKGFESEKKNLNTAIVKINYLNGSIKDFTLFFIFIRRFYTLAILKQNFENADKKNSIKLLNKLKKEEENLYNEYIDGNCFSKVLLALDFERYQFYFKKFAKIFFENIQYTSDPYVNSLLRLKAIFLECSYFTKDNFNLTDFKYFLSENIPFNIPLPEARYELVALRCFFFYELLLEFLTLKPITTHFTNVKNAIVLDLAVIDYKAITKDVLISSLDNLKESLQKIDKKHNDFITRKTVVDKEADINQALLFYKELEDEFEIINKKSKALIDNKYLKLEKMQHLIVLIVNEANLPKFLERFNRKVGNDFSLNTIDKPDVIGTNKEALIYLFHVLCKDKFYVPVNEKISSFLKEIIKIDSKQDVSILDGLEYEDFVEFSFYYIFTLLYSDFNISLSAFNTKLSYTEMVTSNVYFNIKFQSLETLVTRRKIEMKKFLERKFKNIAEYSRHRKNILEEIKLNLETIQDLNRSLSEIKSLETSLIPKLNESSIPMPEKDLILESLKSLKEKQKDCEAEYQIIEKHKFNKKSKSESKEITKNKQAEFKEKLEIENNKSIQVLTETLSCLLENLSEGLKHIEKTRQDVNQVFQKISSAIDQVSISIFKCFSSLNGLSNDKTQDLKNLNLAELLKLVEKIVIENSLIKGDFKEKLIGLIGEFRLLIGSLVEQVNLIIKKYHNCNSEMDKILNSLSSNHPSSQFFSNLIIKEIKPKSRNLIKGYMHLKEQLNFLKKIINLFKCNSDEVLEAYTLIKKLDVHYQKTYTLLNKKMRIYYNNKEKEFLEGGNQVLQQPLQSMNENIEKIPEKKLKEIQAKKVNPDLEKPLSSRGTQTSNSREHCLLTEIVKSTDECSKIRARLEVEYANKERAKADLREITSASRYNFLISRIDPLNDDITTTAKNFDNNQSQTETTCYLNDSSLLQVDTLETNSYNYSQPGPPLYTAPAPTMFFHAPPAIVVDTYRLENRTVFYQL